MLPNCVPETPSPYELFAPGTRYPSLVKVSLVVSPVSPPTLVAKLKSSPSRISTLDGVPVNTKEPERDASPVMSRAASGADCFIPTFPS